MRLGGAGLAALTLALGAWLSGYLTLVLLKLDTGLLQWNTYWTYVRALDHPQVAPYVGKIKLGGAIGFGAPKTSTGIFSRAATSKEGNASVSARQISVGPIAAMLVAFAKSAGAL